MASKTPLPWFRLHAEARTDAKLESLPDDEFRVWFRLLCLASQQPERGVLAGFSVRLLAVEVAHGDAALLGRTLASLIELRIIQADQQGNSTRFIHWRDRQCPPDNGRPPLSEWRILHMTVFERDDFTCQYCGARGVSLQCDHIIPVSRGGGNELDNLTTACRPCNQSKRDKTPEEWQR
jgi:hypothetical protein